jgi:GxxExxY protein
MLICPAHHEELTETIIGCGIEVHRFFGAGLFESVYQLALVFELTAAKLAVEQRRHLPLVYKGYELGASFFADIIVESTVLVEVKAVSALAPVHQAQIITYLKLTGCPVGLLMNFNSTVLRDGIRRVVHPDLYVKSPRNRKR